MKKLLVISVFSLFLTPFAHANWFCQTESNRTWFMYNDGEFSIIQDGHRVLRYGDAKSLCAESYPAQCSVSSDDGRVARILVGDDATGQIYYSRDGRQFSPKVSCTLHPYTK